MLSPDVRECIRTKKVDRGAAFNYMESLDRSLETTFGKHLEDFVVPSPFTVRPVKGDEFRSIVGGRGMAIISKITKSIQFELPDDVSKIPLLVIDCDRSSVNMAALHFLMESSKLMLLYHPDADHMDWNCVKGALVNADWFPWKVLETWLCVRDNVSSRWVGVCQSGQLDWRRVFRLQAMSSIIAFPQRPWKRMLSLRDLFSMACGFGRAAIQVVSMLAPVWALDSGPYNTGGFRTVQAEALEAMMRDGPEGSVWLQFRDRIAEDFGLPAPKTVSENVDLMMTMADALKGNLHAGPSLKMSRWFSWMRQYRAKNLVWHSKLAVLTYWEKEIQKREVSEDTIGEAHPALLSAYSAKTIKEELHRLRPCARH